MTTCKATYETTTRLSYYDSLYSIFLLFPFTDVPQYEDRKQNQMNSYNNFKIIFCQFMFYYRGGEMWGGVVA